MADFELLSGRAQAPLHRSPFHISSFPDGTPGAEFYRTTTGYLLRFPNLADFAVSADLANVWCFPDPDVSEATPQHIYLNQVVPLLLSKRGKLVFHASAVEIEGRAIAFVAESGTGKSTLAANFAISGYRFLTDDGLVVERRGGSYHATPSHPSIRLWQDSREQLIAKHSDAVEMGRNQIPILYVEEEGMFEPIHKRLRCAQRAKGNILCASITQEIGCRQASGLITMRQADPGKNAAF